MDNNKSKKTENNTKGIGRRDVLKSLATLPFAGALLYGAFRKQSLQHYRQGRLLKELGLDTVNEPMPFSPVVTTGGDPLRIGIIGFGIRGEQLLRSAGFAHPELIDSWTEAAAQNRADDRLQVYLEQEDLNIRITGVCDIFTAHTRRALETSANLYRAGSGGQKGQPAELYDNYRDLINADNIDAVIIATPDHWHAEMTIEAARAGKHVYLEKPLSLTVAETHAVEEAVRENGVVFQLGHQNRQIESHLRAKELIEKNILGKITKIECYTNRNSPNGAWVYDIDPEANENTIDWEQFTGPAPPHPFSLERFFRWRCWWDYSTGLTGDLFTHEFDAINQVMDIGIPHSAVASGGIYYYKDGRTVPDVLQVSYQYPERDLSLLYSASLASSNRRNKTFFGHDAHMELSANMTVYADRDSTRYKEHIEAGIIRTDTPLLTYTPGREGVDVVTSATEQYFASRGLLYTYRGGRRVDTTFLHIKEWVDAIRGAGKTSCDIKAGVEEAIAAHMGTQAYRLETKVFWDKDKKEIVTA
ncbi:MAG: gfo/Idh/MocA family oxidoreductase [Marinilabiliales bacterium]|nr:MAG: gfo/Idh/MocA family oxidoreductase [Marinilabiliales bacterium]